LTDEQTALALQNDPSFEEDCIHLKNEVSDAHGELLADFEDPQTSDETLLAGVDRLIAAHNDLETRVARHVVKLRPYLSPEQMDRLLGLCEGRHDANGASPSALGMLGGPLTLGPLHSLPSGH